MSWVQELIDLYESNSHLIGKDTGDGSPILLPISHLSTKTQIEVTIDNEGNYIRGELTDSKNCDTVIPITEKSGNRTSKPEPHPLMDSLQYVAGDLSDYVKGLKENDGYVTYILNLRKWCESEYAHPKVQAIYEYTKKGEMIKDLIKSKVLEVDENGFIPAATKLNKTDIRSCFVRFRVEGFYGDDILNDESGRYRPEVWLDTTVHDSFIRYYNSLPNKRSELCYVNGNESVIAELHPKQLTYDGNAKLISGNQDGKTEFAYKGRFENKDEALSISYDASQKLHNALRWIYRKQGYTKDGISFVSWESNLLKMVSPLEEISGLYFGPKDPEPIVDTNKIEAKKFYTALNGYRKKIKENSHMVVMTFDAATSGRLAITYYNSMSTSRYLDCIEYWHSTGEWRHIAFLDKKPYTFYGMPSVRDIAMALYANEQEGMLKLRQSSGKAPMLKSTVSRLLPCILNGGKIPYDMVKRAVNRASNPQFYDNNFNWEKVLAVACSLVKKFEFENKKEEWTMALDKNNTDRSYLYGRLLAIADKVEYLTYERDDKRQTNAKRYMSKFANSPYTTWEVIDNRIRPYWPKLKEGTQVFYSKLIDEIFTQFEKDDYTDNTKLDGIYLLGYHCQRYELNNRKDSTTEEKTND